MKLKSQIKEELNLAKNLMRKYGKESHDSIEAKEMTAYYEGMALALEWVMESRNDISHVV